MVQHSPATPASSASVVTDWSDNDAMGLLEGLLVQRPILCLSDEPGIGLAAKVAEEVFSHICTLAATATSILLVGHNTRKVIDTGGYIYVFTLGSVGAERNSHTSRIDLHRQAREWLRIYDRWSSPADPVGGWAAEDG